MIYPKDLPGAFFLHAAMPGGGRIRFACSVRKIKDTSAIGDPWICTVSKQDDSCVRYHMTDLRLGALGS